MLSLVPVSFDFPTVTRISRRFVSSASPYAKDYQKYHQKVIFFFLAQIFLFIACLKLVRELLEHSSVSGDTGQTPKVC